MLCQRPGASSETSLPTALEGLYTGLLRPCVYYQLCCHVHAYLPSHRRVCSNSEAVEPEWVLRLADLGQEAITSALDMQF